MHPEIQQLRQEAHDIIALLFRAYPNGALPLPLSIQTSPDFDTALRAINSTIDQISPTQDWLSQAAGVLMPHFHDVRVAVRARLEKGIAGMTDEEWSVKSRFAEALRASLKTKASELPTAEQVLFNFFIINAAVAAMIQGFEGAVEPPAVSHAPAGLWRFLWQRPYRIMDNPTTVQSASVADGFPASQHRASHAKGISFEEGRRKRTTTSTA